MTIESPVRMTSATFRATREYLGLSGAWLARHLDVGERSVRKWDQGEAPVPHGVAEELERLATVTRAFVEREAARLREDQGAWPFEIPRWREDLAEMTPVNDFPLDWWRNVGARLMEAVPGLWLEWIDLYE